MNAPAPVLPNVLPTGPAPAAAQPAVAGEAALNGASFEALVAAEEAPSPAAQALAGEMAPNQPLVGLLPQADVDVDVEEAPVAAAGEPAVDAEALIDPELAVDPTLPPVPTVAEAAIDTVAALPPPHAFGRDKAKGVPAAPALEHANPNARLTEKAGLVEPEATAEEAVAEEPPPRFKGPELPQQAEAVGRRALAAGSAPPRAAEAAQAAVKAVEPDAPEPIAPPAAPADVEAATAAAAQATPAAATLAARPTQGPAPRTEPSPKADRGRDAVEAPAPKAAAGAAPAPAASAAKPAAAAPAADTLPAPDEALAAAEPEAVETTDSAPSFAEPRAGAPASQTSHAAAHTPVRGSPETVAHLAAQIVKKLEGRSSRFDVELTPAGLGRVDVRIEIGANGRLTAAMMVDNPQAASELRARADELQRALEQAGFDLAGGLSFDVADHRGHARHQHEQDEAPMGQGFRAHAFQAALDNAGAADTASGILRLRRGVNAGVDVRI